MSSQIFKDLLPVKDPKGGSPKTPGDSPKANQTTPYPPPYWTKDIEPRKVGFFHIQFRDLLYTLSIAAAALLFIFQRQSDVHDLFIKITSSEKIQEQLTTTIQAQQKLIDNNTTRIELQSQRNLDQDRRIAEAQSQLLLLVPDVREIRTKLNFVADLLDQRSKQKP